MLPPEIFSEIFSFLASEARVLLACSQAHPIFAQLVEPTLYAHVVIDRVAYYEDEHHLRFTPYQLSTLLSDNPRILNYLRSLRVELFTLFAYREAMKEITAILLRLKLERIQLTFASRACARWEWLFKSFRTAFVACISTSYMREICLDNVGYIPLPSFADCAGLKRLTLWTRVVPPSNRSFKFPQLEALELFDWEMADSSRGFLSWALTHASGLRSLTLSTPRKKVIRRFLPHLLTICSTSLVNLNIYYFEPIHHRSNTSLIEIDFPGLPSLERLCLCTYTGSVENPPISNNNLVRYALTTVAQILRNLSSLKYLTLIVCLQFGDRDITQVDWSPLVNFLSDRHSAFQHIDLYIRAVKAGGGVCSDEVISMLSGYESLMSLVEAGRLSIKEKEYHDKYVNRFFREYSES